MSKECIHFLGPLCTNTNTNATVGFVQTGPGAHPSSYTVSTGSFPGVKRPGRGVDHRPPPSAEVKERVDLYLYPPLGFPGLF